MSDQLQFLAQELAQKGMKHAFGVTGSGDSLRLITYLEDAGVHYYSAAHEASAAIMAGGVHSANGSPAAAISIKGPGVTNLLPGIAHNYFENIPIITLSEAYGETTPNYRRHKRLNHLQMLSPIVKGSIPLNAVESDLNDLLQLASQEIPGPVHIELCNRENTPQSIFRTSIVDNVETEKAIAALDRIQQAQRPILIIGSLATRRPWKEQIHSLNFPVFTTAAAKGTVDESLPNAAGIFTGDGKSLAPESSLIPQSDLVIGLGLRNLEIISPKPFLNGGILFDEASSEFAEGFQADFIQLEQGSVFIEELLRALAEKSWGLDLLDQQRTIMRTTLLEDQWLPAACFDVLNRLSFSYRLVLDTGSFCTIGEHIWVARQRHQFLGSSNGRYMGTALPSSIGVALGSTQPVICVVGDGGMRTYPAELKMAVSEGLPLCVILMSDGLYGSISSVPQPHNTSQRAVSIVNPTWWKAAEAMGCSAVPVNSLYELESILQQWTQSAPLFIEAVFNPTTYATMTRNLR